MPIVKDAVQKKRGPKFDGKWGRLLFLFVILFCSACQEGPKIKDQSEKEVGISSEKAPAGSPLPAKGSDLYQSEALSLKYSPKYKAYQEKLKQVEATIQKDVQGPLSGAVLLVLYEGEICYFESFGDKKRFEQKELLHPTEPMEKDTLFDLASLTKAYAGAIAIMKLADDGLLRISDRVCSYLPQFKEGEKGEITIEMLLNHSSGLKAYVPLYQNAKTKKESLNGIEKLPLGKKEEVYSDLGYMVLGMVVEKVAGKPLDVYLSEQVYGPMGLSHTLYRPLENGRAKKEAAATERMGNTRDGHISWPGIRRHTLQGEVHDELCYYAMESVSAHAGLFSNAYELGLLSQMFLDAYKEKEEGLIKRQTLRDFTRVKDKKKRYLLGFDYAMHEKNQSIYGKYVSDTAFGKTGWTGTLALMDPEKELAIILLTNKRHSETDGKSFEGAKTDTGRYRRIIEGVYEGLNLTK